MRFFCFEISPIKRVYKYIFIKTDGYHENWCQNKLFYKLNFLHTWITKKYAIIGNKSLDTVITAYWILYKNWNITPRTYYKVISGKGGAKANSNISSVERPTYN